MPAKPHHRTPSRYTARHLLPDGPGPEGVRPEQQADCSYGKPDEGLGHTLRTPLTALHGALGLLGAGLAGDLPPDARALIAIALRNCCVLEGVVETHLETLAGSPVAPPGEPLNPGTAFS